MILWVLAGEGKRRGGKGHSGNLRRDELGFCHPIYKALVF